MKAIAVLHDVDAPLFEEHGTFLKPKIIQVSKVSLAPFIRFFSKNPYYIYIGFIILAAISGYLGVTNQIIIVGNFVTNEDDDGIPDEEEDEDEDGLHDHDEEENVSDKNDCQV